MSSNRLAYLQLFYWCLYIALKGNKFMVGFNMIVVGKFSYCNLKLVRQYDISRSFDGKSKKPVGNPLLGWILFLFVESCRRTIFTARKRANLDENRALPPNARLLPSRIIFLLKMLLWILKATVLLLKQPELTFLEERRKKNHFWILPFL